MTTLAADVPTILVADDDSDLLKLMARRLTRAGYEVITASDGAQALQLAEQSLPQLAVLDIMMPKLTGIEVTRQLRANPSTQEIGVILISAGFYVDADEAGRPTGADDFVKKPFSAHELPQRVHDVLNRRARPT